MTSLQEPTAKCENDPMVVMSDPAEDPADEDDYSFDSTAAVPQTKLQRPNNLTIPELLAMRESFGHSSLRLPRFSRPRQLHPDVLSSKIAW